MSFAASAQWLSLLCPPTAQEGSRTLSRVPTVFCWRNGRTGFSLLQVPVVLWLSLWLVRLDCPSQLFLCLLFVIVPDGIIRNLNFSISAPTFSKCFLSHLPLYFSSHTAISFIFHPRASFRPTLPFLATVSAFISQSENTRLTCLYTSRHKTVPL